MFPDVIEIRNFDLVFLLLSGLVEVSTPENFKAISFRNQETNYMGLKVDLSLEEANMWQI